MSTRVLNKVLWTCSSYFIGLVERLNEGFCMEHLEWLLDWKYSNNSYYYPEDRKKYCALNVWMANFTSIKCLLFNEWLKYLMNDIKMNFIAWTWRKYAVYFGKRLRIQSTQIRMPLWLSDFFLHCWSPRLPSPSKEFPPFLINLSFNSAGFRHGLEWNPKVASFWDAVFPGRL